MMRTTACLLLVLLTACMMEVEGSEQPLIDATPELGEEAVLYMMAPQSSCTATLIAPRVVTVAKHCICNGTGFFGPSNLKVFTGNRVGEGVEYAPIQNVTYPPGACAAPWDNHDFALFTLANEGGLTPYEPILDAVDEPPAGSTVLNVGYGTQVSGYHPSQVPRQYVGEKRSRTSILEQSLQMELVINGPGPVACYGDSGGPVFTQDKKQLGVASRVEGYCQGRSIYTKLSAFKDLIEQAFVETGATMPGDPTGPGNDPVPVPPEPEPMPEPEPEPEPMPEPMPEPLPLPEQPEAQPEAPIEPLPEAPVDPVSPDPGLEAGSVLIGNGCSVSSTSRASGLPALMFLLVGVVLRRRR